MAKRGCEDTDADEKALRDSCARLYPLAAGR
jgi:hypothetical protein